MSGDLVTQVKMTSPLIWKHCRGLFLPVHSSEGYHRSLSTRSVSRKTEQDLCFLSAFRSEHRIHNEFYACIWLVAMFLEIHFFLMLHHIDQFTAPSDMVVLFIQDGVSGEEDWSNFIRLLLKNTGVGGQWCIVLCLPGKKKSHTKHNFEIGEDI